MANIAIFRVNYKSDFILTLHSDAGWMTPFCIKFWTASPSQAYFAGFDGTTYTHCAPVEGEPTKLQVQFDDHHLPIGDLKFQIGYHFTVADFPTSVEDEVINQASVIIEVDDAPAQVMLDFNGETAPEIEFSLLAYANEAQRIANEEQRIANEQSRVLNESRRVEAEVVREQQEQSRLLNESQRIQSEQARVSAEASRVTAEQDRVDAEAHRIAEFGQLARESETATASANDAAALAAQKAGLADDAATLATQKAGLADDAATLANQKAGLATDAAELATQKAGLADDAATLATQKAGLADDAATLATQKAGLADDAATLATQKAGLADDAATLANQKAGLATDAAELATQKAGLADDAATLATQKAGLADDAATLATQKAGLADDAATLANQKAQYAQDQGDYAKAQGDYAKAQTGLIPVGVTRTQTDVTFVNNNNDPLFYLRQATPSLAGLMTAAEHTKLNDMPSAQEVNAGLAYDVSVLHPTSGVSGGSTYASLSAALAVIPQDKRKGGMTVKFVLSSDNKYVQYRLTAEAFSTNVEDWDEAGKGDVSKEDLENGTVIPALAENLASWAEDVSEVSNSWDEIIRTTAGDDPIDTAYGGVLTDIVAKSDFKCDALVTSGYNLLRLASAGGVAVAVGNGWYFPVPHLELGAFGDATKNNGVLLTDKDGNNIKNATVRFKALADGVPTSENDGVAASYQDVTYNDETFRTYLTSGAGYLIVSGITYADTCAHLAWEDWYDKYVSPTAEDDAGDSISLTALFTAAPNGTGKFLVLGSGGNTVATRATRTSSTQMTITDPIGRVTSPSWTNELQEDEETYKHSLTISDMKADGLAQIEGSDQVLTVVGTTVSYTDTNATAISGAVRYEKATAATANVTLTKTQYALNDCGIEMKSGATGEAYFGCTYSQNVADALSQIAKVKLDISLSVVAEAMLYLYNENKALQELLAGKDNAVLPVVKAQSVECDDILTMGVPNALYSSVAGAPSAANVPDNWDEGTMTVWNGCPRKIGQQYVDKVNKKVYYAVAVTGSTNDWVVLN